MIPFSRSVLRIAALAVLTAPLAAQTPAKTATPAPTPVLIESAALEGLFPADRDSVAIAAGERNPFGRRGPRVEEHAPDAESEESRIRSVLAQMTVSGVSHSAAGPRVLFGWIILEAGRPLPDLVENQTEKLFVRRIESDHVEISWVEAGDAAEPRTFIAPIRIRPERPRSISPPAPAEKPR